MSIICVETSSERREDDGTAQVSTNSKAGERFCRSSSLGSFTELSKRACHETGACDRSASTYVAANRIYR